MPFKSIIRFGSTTEIAGNYIEINTTQSVRNAANKLLTKRCFDKVGVKTAPWCEARNLEENLKNKKLKYPVVVKGHYGSRGTSNYKINSEAEWKSWNKGRDLSNYIVELYMPYLLEFRLHCTKDGCFYACRKALKKDTPKEEKWSRHDDNCIWYMESNTKEFLKPSNWKNIVNDCVNALNSVGLSVGAFDVKVQGKEHKNPDYFLIEVNSAASHGSITTQKYLEILPKLLKDKYEETK